MNNLVVLVQKVGKNSIEDLGSPDKFLQDNAYLFGESAAFTGERARRARRRRLCARVAFAALVQRLLVACWSRCNGRGRRRDALGAPADAPPSPPPPPARRRDPV